MWTSITSYFYLAHCVGGLDHVPPHHCLLSCYASSTSYGAYWAMFACQDCGVALILPQHLTSSHADAGVVIASHLPKWKNLSKVEVKYTNPVPILWSTVSCGKLAEVVIRDPKHCKVSFSDLPCPGTHMGMLLDRTTTPVESMGCYWAIGGRFELTNAITWLRYFS